MNIEFNNGVKGEFKIEVQDREGNIRQTIDWQDNLILDNFFKLTSAQRIITSAGTEFDNDDIPTNPMYYCAVGSGNNTPKTSDIKLAYLENYTNNIAWGDVELEEPETSKHDGFVKVSVQRKFIFDDIDNKNITEVGLCWFNDQESSDLYLLFTRALVKDTSSQLPISVTVLSGEILYVYYTLHYFVDIRVKSGTFTLTSKQNEFDSGTTSKYDYIAVIDDIKSSENYWSNMRFTGGDSLTSWGVKEDEEGDLTQEPYVNLNWRNFSTIRNQVSDDRKDTYHTNESNAKYSNHNTTWESVPDKNGIKKTLTVGLNSHNHSNGIRSFFFDVRNTNQSQNNCFDLNVFVSKKDDHSGLPKTEKQLWKCGYTLAFSRWEE